MKSYTSWTTIERKRTSLIQDETVISPIRGSSEWGNVRYGMGKREERDRERVNHILIKLINERNVARWW